MKGAASVTPTPMEVNDETENTDHDGEFDQEDTPTALAAARSAKSNRVRITTPVNNVSDLCLYEHILSTYIITGVSPATLSDTRQFRKTLPSPQIYCRPFNRANDTQAYVIVAKELS